MDILSSLELIILSSDEEESEPEEGMEPKMDEEETEPKEAMEPEIDEEDQAFIDQLEQGLLEEAHEQEPLDETQE